MASLGYTGGGSVGRDRRMTTRTPKKGSTVPENWQALFLVSLAAYGNVTAACRKARVSRNTAYEARKADADFTTAWDEALTLGTAGLEDEARRRAFEGTSKPVYQGGVLVGKIQEYSDTLLIFLLKAHKPEVYRETINQQHGGSMKLIIEYGNADA